MIIIGDVHGKVHAYQNIIKKYNESICVGDFGFKNEWDWHSRNVYGSHDINMGNHDYIPYLNTHHASTGNWNYYPTSGIFTVRGAWSIDRVYRTEGIDWFDNEELSYPEGLVVFDKYREIRPKIVVSHDCPHSIRHSFFGITDKSNTSNLLQALFEEHQPELWIFGHYHKSRDSIIKGTRFICLEELQTFEI